MFSHDYDANSLRNGTYLFGKRNGMNKMYSNLMFLFGNKLSFKTGSNIVNLNVANEKRTVRRMISTL